MAKRAEDLSPGQQLFVSQMRQQIATLRIIASDIEAIPAPAAGIRQAITLLEAGAEAFIASDGKWVALAEAERLHSHHD